MRCPKCFVFAAEPVACVCKFDNVEFAVASQLHTTARRDIGSCNTHAEFRNIPSRRRNRMNASPKSQMTNLESSSLFSSVPDTLSRVQITPDDAHQGLPAGLLTGFQCNLHPTPIIRFAPPKQGPSPHVIVKNSELKFSIL
jgi:hypothetical protein